MIIKAKPRKSYMDVALANVDTYIPYSDQVMIIRDLSVHTKENLLPKRPDYLVVKANADNSLKFTNTFSEVEVADLFGFNIDTFNTNPLWYKYTLSMSYHNKTKTTQRVSKRIDLNENNFKVERLTSNQSTIIIKNSVNLKYTDQLGATILYGPESEGDKFIVNYGRRDMIYIETGISGLDTRGTMNVIFDTIDIDLEIDIDNPEDYLISAVQFDTNTYIITIFSTSKIPTKIRYLTRENEDLHQIEETTSFEPVFVQVNDTQDVIQPKAFLVQNNKIKLKTTNLFTDYAIRQKILTNTKVYVTTPFALPRQEPWFLKVTQNEFIKDGLTYKVFNSDVFTRKPYVKYEQPIVVDEHTIQLSQTPLYQKSKTQITGIEINTIDGAVLSIVSINNVFNTIVIKEAISAKDVLTVKYKYDDGLLVIPKHDFNPRNRIDPNFELMKSIAVIFILPQEELIDPKKPIFVGYLPRYDTGQELQYNDQDILELMISKHVLPLVKNNVNTTDIHPVALSVLTIDNKTLPKISNIKDVRVRGGGVHSNIGINQEIGDSIYQMLDIGKWDGETFDVGGILIFRVPQVVKQHVLSFLRNDEDYVFAVTDDIRNRILEDKTIQFFREMINKRKPAGKRVLIEFLE